MNEVVSGPTPGDATPGPSDTPDGRSTRWNAHRATRREELLDAAIRAIDTLGADGSDVGLEQIAAIAHTSKPVLYRYFADKSELHRAVSERVVAQIVAGLSALSGTTEPRAMLREAIDGYLLLLADHPGVFRFLNQARQLTRTGDAVATVLTAHLGEQLRACGLDPVRAAPWGDGAIAFIRTASLWWLDNPDAMTRSELSDYLEALLWGGAAGVYQLAGRDVDGRPAPGVFPAGSTRPPGGTR